MQKYLFSLLISTLFLLPLNLLSQENSDTLQVEEDSYYEFLFDDFEYDFFSDPLDEIYPFVRDPISNFNSISQTFNHTFTIAKNDTIIGNIIVKKGDLFVEGTLLGDALVLKGDVNVGRNGKITGDVTTLRGEVIRRGRIGGTVEEKNKRKVKKRKYEDDYESEYFYTPQNWKTSSNLRDGLIINYNRVERFELGFAKYKKLNLYNIKPLSSHWMFSYSTGLHKWEGEIGISRNILLQNSIFQLTAEYHSLVDTDDEWIISDEDNSFSALFSKDDYFDYFEKKGGSVGLEYHYSQNDIRFFLSSAYHKNNYSSLNRTSDWALFGKNEFRENPTVAEGLIPSVTFNAGFSTTGSNNIQATGWNFHISYEKGGIGNEKLYSFERTIFDVRRYQSLSKYDKLNFRIRYGILNGDQIQQRKLFLGGYNSLPAYSYKEFDGNRMLLINSEYYIKGSLIDMLFPWINNLNLILLADAGEIKNYAGTTLDPTKSFFKSLTFKTIKSDVGFGLSWKDNDGRLSYLWRTDKETEGSIALQLTYPF